MTSWAALAALLGTGAATLFAAPAAPAVDPRASESAVSIGFAGFTPPEVRVLAGDTVTWTNVSVRHHTVVARDLSFASPPLYSRDTFSRRFGAAGSVAYYCTLHPTMQGEVEVERVLLKAPATAAGPRRPFPLSGRAAVPPGSSVQIEGDAGGGFRPAAGATVGRGGRFTATVTPQTSTHYRAVVDGAISQPVQLLVQDRKLAVRAARRGRTVVVTARVAPPAPGMDLVLQFRLRERFGWSPVRHARLDDRSRARFAVRTRRAVHARVLLTLADRATVLAGSAELRVGRARG